MRNPDIVCLQELPPGYRWYEEDGDFHIADNVGTLGMWIRVATKAEGELYQLRSFGVWLSYPTEDLQALVDVTVARFWIGDLPP